MAPTWAALCFLLPRLAVANRPPPWDRDLEDPKMSLLSLVQAKARAARTLKLGDLSGVSAERPWDSYVFYVGTHHKAGSQLLRNVARHAFDGLGAPASCHMRYAGNDSYVTSADNDKFCDQHPEIPIRWDNNAMLGPFLAARETAGPGLLRAVQTIRKPKDMMVSAYCYHHRGKEFGEFKVPWPEIMEMGPVEGMMAVWSSMQKIFGHMVELYTTATSEELFPFRYEEVTSSSAQFDATVERLYRFLFEPFLSESDLRRILEASRVEDLHRDEGDIHGISAGSDHQDPDSCIQEAGKALQSLDPSVLRQLKELQAALQYSTENWPDPVIQ